MGRRDDCRAAAGTDIAVAVSERSGWRTAALATVIGVGVALRLYPIHVHYLNPELQELYTSNAVIETVRGSWGPRAMHHGSALFDVLRTLFTGWYAVGYLTGAYADRIDFLATWLQNSFPFVVAGRVLMVLISSLGLVLVPRLATRELSPAAGIAAALLLGVNLIHVRETHNVWLDVPAGIIAVACIATSLRAARTGGRGALVLAAMLAALGIATKHSAVPIVLPVALAALMGASGVRHAIARSVMAGSIAISTYVVLSPHVFIEFRQFRSLLFGMQLGVTFAEKGLSLPLPTLLELCIGWPTLALAAVGLVTAAWNDPRRTAILGAFPVAYLLMLAPSPSIFARYLSVLAPMVAFFGGGGAAMLARRIVPRFALPGAVLIAAVAGAGQARESLAQIRLLAREDTRNQSAEWIKQNVPADTLLLLPNAVWYPNPALPLGPNNLKVSLPDFAEALAERGVPDPKTTHPLRFHKFFWAVGGDVHRLAPIVVTATHPATMPDLHAAPELMQALKEARARPVAEFHATEDMRPQGVVYDPLGEYLPLRGAALVRHLGPNLIIWKVDAARPGRPRQGASPG